VEVVRDGQQAVDFLFGEGEFAGRNSGELPWSVLLDLNLPRLSGLEVLLRLRANRARGCCRWSF
jgi:CheY-like chemotaxis protein